ncbi:MAG: GAF domain-containing protein, partial [Bradyrhizobium sp.]|uniref:GAF domain-containing protein n=1 Tax=Bradyrhizobium sp. TaxID=376 RepID=UPI001DB80889
MTALPQDAVTDLKTRIAELEQRLQAREAENARLQDQTREALEWQAATAEILASISASITDPAPVFDTILDNLLRLFGTRFAAVFLLRDGMLHAAGLKGEPGFEGLARHYPIALDERLLLGKTILSGRALQIAPIMGNPEATPGTQEIAREFGYDAIIAVPMLREGGAIGVLATAHRDPIAFTQKQMELATSFADQAVIAIENARLFDEVQAKTRDLEESLQQQTATADVLKVISSSPGELEPVFRSMLENAVSICDAKFGNLFLVDGETARWRAGMGTPPKLVEFFTQTEWFRPTAGSHLDRVIRTKQVSHTSDDTAEAVVGAAARLGGARSTVCVPMVKDDALAGAIFIYRTEVRPFTDKQIDLLKNFAAQAVIAIENARLLTELRQRTDDLSESLQQQTATADVLKVISRSAFDLQAVLETLIKSAVELSGANRGSIFLREEDVFPLKAASSTTPEFLQYWAANPPRAGRGSATSRVIASGKVEIIPDVLDDPKMQIPAGSL